MTRRIRLAGATAASSFALIAGACGGGNATPTTTSTTSQSAASRSTPTTQTSQPQSDQTIARRVFAAELSAVHRSIRGTWRRNRTGRARTVVSCPGEKALREGPTAMVVSPSYVKGRQIEFRTGSYVYRDSEAASKALHTTGAQQGQACRARLLVRLLRAGGYATGSPTARRSSPQGIGEEAQFVEISVPVSFRGRRLKFILDQTATRQGRLIEGFVTLAGASTAHYNQEFGAVFARIARAAQ
jgi:hypothetical protein